jgi:hypothetical protein
VESTSQDDTLRSGLAIVTEFVGNGFRMWKSDDPSISIEWFYLNHSDLLSNRRQISVGDCPPTLGKNQKYLSWKACLIAQAMPVSATETGWTSD